VWQKIVKRLTDKSRDFKQTGAVICFIRRSEDVCLSTIYQAHVYDKAMPHNITASSLSHKSPVCKIHLHILIIQHGMYYQLSSRCPTQLYILCNCTLQLRISLVLTSTFRPFSDIFNNMGKSKICIALSTICVRLVTPLITA